MELHIDFDAPLQGEARATKINELASQHPIFLNCREAQASLSNTQQLIRRTPGVSAHQADELCELLMRAGQTFNVAVKSAVEDWAEQSLQANELKKTISNWGQDDGHRDEEREEELQEALSNTFDLRCRLQTFRERFENIQYETDTIINEFGKLRNLVNDNEAFCKSLTALFKTLDGQIRNREKLFSLLDNPSSPSISSDYGMLEQAERAWNARGGAKGGSSHSDVFSHRSGAPSPEARPASPDQENNGNMQMVVAGPRQPQPFATAYPGSSGPNGPKTPAGQQAQTGVRPLAASAPHNTLVPHFKTPAPSSRRQPVRSNPIGANLGSPVGRDIVASSPLESPFERPNSHSTMPSQRLEPSFRFPGTPNHMPQAIRPSPANTYTGRSSGGRGMGPRHGRGPIQPHQLMVQRPSTAFRPQANEFRPTIPRSMHGQNMGGYQNHNPRAGPPYVNHHHQQHHQYHQQQQQQQHQQQQQQNQQYQQPRGSGRGGTARGGGFQAAAIAGSASRAQVGREGLDSSFLTAAEKAIDGFYQVTRGWVAEYAGNPDARQALTVKESAVWPAIVAAYPPLTPLEANAYIDIHIRDPLYRPCLVSRLIIDFFIARVWSVLAWTGFDDQTDKALLQLRDDFDRLGPQPAFQRQLLLERQSELIGRILSAPGYAAFQATRAADIQSELAALVEPLLSRFARRDFSFSDLKDLADRGWEVTRLMGVGRTHFGFRFPHTGDRFSATAMRPVFPDKPAQQLQAEHWRVSLVVSPSITCIRDNGGRISVHDLFSADVVCMQ